VSRVQHLRRSNLVSFFSYSHSALSNRSKKHDVITSEQCQLLTSLRLIKQSSNVRDVDLAQHRVIGDILQDTFSDNLSAKRNYMLSDLIGGGSTARLAAAVPKLSLKGHCFLPERRPLVPII